MRSFIIPDAGNSITANDIENGILRITVEFKNYFPSESGHITISYGQKQSKEISFTHKTGRSHVLGIGKSVMEALKLKPGGKVKFTELVPRKHFILEKL